MPLDCIPKIFVRAGLQKWHWPADIMQLRFSLQAPHWQDKWLPTRFTSSLSIWDSDCAKTEAANISSSRANTTQASA
jgi:hypothetical protein